MEILPGATAEDSETEGQIVIKDSHDHANNQSCSRAG